MSRVKGEGHGSVEIVVGSVVRHWTNAARRADAVVRILSPYVTSQTVDRVFECAKTGCELYTVFEAENFVTGASSIRSLLRLRRRGCMVYHIAGLHAKIILAKPSFASIGSQNVTHRGGRSKEATAIVRTPSRVVEIERDLEAWIAVATEVSLEMISEMAQLVAPLCRQFKELQKASAQVDACVVENEKGRLEREASAAQEKEQQLIAARARAEELAIGERAARLSSALTPLLQGAGAKRGRVTLAYDGYGSSTESLLVERNESLLKWDGNLTLRRLHRYLCVVEGSGKLGWARVAQTRITKIEDGLVLSELFHHLGRTWSVSFEATRAETLRTTGQNVIVRLRPNVDGTGDLEVGCWFDVHSLQVVQCAVRLDPFVVQDPEMSIAAAEIERQPERFAEWVVPRLLAPFKYVSNLRGAEAGDFFGALGTYWTLRLAAAGTQQFLVASNS